MQESRPGNIRSTISPTANAVSPFATCASFGRNGAPAAVPRRKSPMDNPSESGKTISIPIASKGTSIKFAASERITSLTLCSGEKYLRNCKGKAHAKHTGEHKDQCSKDTYGFKEVQKGNSLNHSSPLLPINRVPSDRLLP